MSKHQPVTNDDKSEGGLELTGSRGQQILIIVLVVAIAAIFGMQGSIELLGQSGNPYQDALVYKGTGDQLQGLLNPQGWRFPGLEFSPTWNIQATEEQILDYYKEQLQLADLASDEGLMPGGETLENIYNDFLDTTNPLEGGKTFRDIIHPVADREAGRPPAITRRDLLQYLQVSKAIVALKIRHLIDVAAMPRLAGRYAYHAQQDKALVDRVEISTAVLIDKDPRYLEEASTATEEIDGFYHKNRDQLFTVDAKLTLSLVYASGVELGKKIKIPEEDIVKYYDDHKDTYAIPAPPAEAPKEGEEPPTPEKTFKPLADVRDEIRGILEKERGTDLARNLMAKSEKVLLDRRLIGKDAPEPVDLEAIAAVLPSIGITPEENPALIEPVYLSIARDLPTKVVKETYGENNDQRIAWAYDLGETFGKIEAGKYIRLHEKPVGWMLADAITPPNRKHLRILVRIDASEPASYRPLDEVRDRVIRYLAARRAWADLMDRATTLRTEVGTTSLAEHFAKDEVKQFWDATTTTGEKISLMQGYGEPSRDIEVVKITREEPLYGNARLGGVGPVIISRSPAPAKDDHPDELLPYPALTLLQVTGIERAKEATDEDITRGVQFQAQAFSAYLGAEFNAIIQQRLAE